MNDYPSWLVSTEIARKLKEIGFNEPCLLSYDLTLETNSQLSGDLGYCTFSINDFDNGDIPTWEQVIEWFIEKNLIGKIEYGKFDEKDPYYAYCITNKMTKVLDYSSNTTRYKTYREAREALVNKLIKLYGKK